tara:strand:- start:216 stop:803 length:588 start_codon:yes stop_codon:yes gene_type:complete
MPISINGSGTVTGVSVGGLPDGIVDADMLANNAVTPVKRGTSSILQIVQNTNNDREAKASNTYVATNKSVTITPLVASSKIHLIFTGDVNTEANSRPVFLDIYRSVNGGTFEGIAPVGSAQTVGANNNNGFSGEIRGSSSRIQVPFVINYLDSPTYSVGNAIEYKIYIRSDGNQVEIPSNNLAQPVVLMAMEIAG